jgi:hypothetical protein
MLPSKENAEKLAAWLLSASEYFGKKSPLGKDASQFLGFIEEVRKILPWESEVLVMRGMAEGSSANCNPSDGS